MTTEYSNCIKRGKIKPFSRGKSLAVKELESGESDLQRGKKTFAYSDYKWSTVQSYYAMFHK